MVGATQLIEGLFELVRRYPETLDKFLLIQNGDLFPLTSTSTV